jgi:hypothetical protein
MLDLTLAVAHHLRVFVLLAAFTAAMACGYGGF